MHKKTYSLKYLAIPIFSVMVLIMMSCTPNTPVETTTTIQPTTTTTTESPNTTTTTSTTTIPEPEPEPALDPSGKTIPTTSYPIPAGAVFISPNGDDAGDGSISQPVKTLDRSVALVPAGGTVVMREGSHRVSYQRNGLVRHINKSITFQAYPGEQAWFDGADIVADGWAQQGSVWVRDWDTPTFCNGKYNLAVNSLPPFSHLLNDSGVPRTDCGWTDQYKDPAYPIAADPQQIFINGNKIPQKLNLSDLGTSSSSFYYDWFAKKIYMNVDPNQHIVELAARPDLFVFGGAYDFAIRGVGVKRYASSNGNNVIYAGLGGVSTYAQGSVQFESIAVTDNSGYGIGISGPKNKTFVKNSVFAHNGFTALGSNGFANSNPRNPVWMNSLLIQGNLFNANNDETLDTKCNIACGGAHIKLAHMSGFEVRDNIFENARGRAPGFWCDIDCSYGVMVNNIARFNGGHGIFYEISNHGIIANNLVYHNEGTGIAVAAANTKVYNNTVVQAPGPRVQSYWIWDDRRMAPDKGETWPYINPRVDLGPNTNNIEFANNLIVAQQPTGARLMQFGNDSIVPPNTQSNDYFSVLDNNLYYHLPNQNLYMWAFTDAIKTFEQLRSVSGQQWELNSVSVVGSGDPFVDRGSFDFRVRPDTEVFSVTPRQLPLDVSAVLGHPVNIRIGKLN